jgi:serine/threonine-protein kinase
MPETQSVKGDADTLPDLAAVEPISLPGRFNPDQIPPSIHERFDDLQFLGRGGMGTVYRGYDKRLTREVAIKFVHGHDALRFLREARAQAKITHDNVCKIYDVGLADGQPYITMQLVRGESLGVVCKEMTLEEKVKVIRESASALHEAHRMGLVHRDVKPGNILVERSEDGGYRPFVMDFGLARIAGEKGETMTGQIAGTPAYMAPEQARGEIRSLDRRTDVYSLGATFYDILADHPPFVDEQPWKILMRISSEDAPALSSVCPNVPIDVETIIMKCLEREQARRYESARALGEDLQRYLDGNVVLARKASVLHRWAKRARKHKLLVSLASVALIVAVVVVFLGLRARRIAGEQARIAQEMGENVKEMQLFMQYAHALPVHDIEREQAVIRKRLVDIATKMAAGGAIGRGAGEYALGRGFLALEEPENALEHLNEAETAGMVSPENGCIAANFGRKNTSYAASRIGYDIQDAGIVAPAQSDRFAFGASCLRRGAHCIDRRTVRGCFAFGAASARGGTMVLRGHGARSGSSSSLGREVQTRRQLRLRKDEVSLRSGVGCLSTSFSHGFERSDGVRKNVRSSSSMGLQRRYDRKRPTRAFPGRKRGG